jgi:dTMP kinase
MKAKYYVFESTEGMGKSTQCNNVAEYLKSEGYRVLVSKEPGTYLSPITMQLRSLMLDAQYEEQLSIQSRELISQAIRSIHLHKVIAPALYEYDFVLQDRGILSGLGYGEICGNDINWLIDMADRISLSALDVHFNKVYDGIFFMIGDVEQGLMRARGSKQEFSTGDAIENKGVHFMKNVYKSMYRNSEAFPTTYISIDNKSIDEVSKEIISHIMPSIIV